MSSPHIRASGHTAGQESAFDEDNAVTALPDAELKQSRNWRTPGFRRMRTDWDAEDLPIIQRAHKYAADRIVADFPEVFQILEEIYAIVREPQRDENGQVIRSSGLPVWKRTLYGYEEHWDRLTVSQREHFLYRISTNLFTWQMKAENIYVEAMLAKTQWEERYSIAYDSPASGTMGEREAKGKVDAIDERYFAVLRSAYSRRADSIVGHMNGLCQRLAQGIRG